MISSIEAFNMGGYKYNALDYADKLLEGNILDKIEMGSRYPGYWTIPVCEIESSGQWDDTGLGTVKETSLYWKKVDKNHPDKGTGQKMKGQDGVQ